MSEHIIDVSDAASERQHARRGHRRPPDDTRRLGEPVFFMRILGVGCGWFIALWAVLFLVGTLYIGVAHQSGLIGLVFLMAGSKSLSEFLVGFLVAVVSTMVSIALPLCTLVFVFRWFLPLSRRAILRDAADVLERDERPLVLYLRSFAADTTGLRGAGWRRYATGWRRQGSFEAIIVERLWEYGPVVALAKPVMKGRWGEAREKGRGNDRQLVFQRRLPVLGHMQYSRTTTHPLGAARERLPSENWQATILGRMRQAQLIVVVMGGSEGLTWELNQVQQAGLADKLFFVVPPIEADDAPRTSHHGREAELREQWESVCHVAAQGGSMYLPIPIDVKRTRAVVPGVDDDATVIVSRTNWVIDYEAAVDTAAEVVLDRQERRGRDLEYSSAPEVALSADDSVPTTEVPDAPPPRNAWWQNLLFGVGASMVILLGIPIIFIIVCIVMLLLFALLFVLVAIGGA